MNKRPPKWVNVKFKRITVQLPDETTALDEYQAFNDLKDSGRHFKVSQNFGRFYVYDEQSAVLLVLKYQGAIINTKLYHPMVFLEYLTEVADSVKSEGLDVFKDQEMRRKNRQRRKRNEQQTT